MNSRLKAFFAIAFALPALLVSTLVIGTSSSAGAAETVVEDEQWPNPMAAIPGLHGMILEDGTLSGGGTVSVMSTTSPSAGELLCSSLASAPCVSADNYYYQAMLAPCSASIAIDCIEGITSISPTQVAVPGTYKEMFPKKGANEFDGSVEKGVPMGRTPSLWTLSGAPHAFGSDYVVMVSVGGDKSMGSKRSLTASIVPVNVFDTGCDSRYESCSIDVHRQQYDNNGKGKISFAGNAADYGKYRCVVWAEEGRCALGHAFPAGFSYELKIRLSSEPVGWLHGRMKDPNIDFATIDGKTTVSITAAPVRVPTVAGVAMWPDLPADLQKWFTDTCAASRCGTRAGLSSDPLQSNAITGASVYSEAAFNILKLWTNFIKDKATVLTSQWRVRTLSNSEMGSAASCISKATGVTGIVTTNSLLYSEGPPTFNTETKTLNYKVASPHYEKDGVTEFKGTYNLTVRDDIAECLYGFSDTLAAPSTVYAEETEYTEPDVEQYVDAVEATYDEAATEADFSEEEPLVEEVTLEEIEADESALTLDESDDEEVVVARVAADVVTELQKTAAANTTIDLSDGWFKFAATNFTFSAPTLKVALGVNPAKTLTCIAGASLKKVTAVSPKCPAGYAKAVTKYCIKGKTVDVVVAASPRCLKKFSAATAIECGRGASAKRVIAVKPKCPKGYGLVTSVVCIKNTSVRLVTMVRPQCASGFAKAVTLTCTKGKRTTKVTALKPACPKGYSRKR